MQSLLGVRLHEHLVDPALRVLRLCIYTTLQIKTVKLQKCAVSHCPFAVQL